MDAHADCSCNLPHCCKTGGKIPLESILAECDAHFNSGNPAAVGETLRRALTLAQENGDAQSELTLLNELMGHYRMAGDADRGSAAVKSGFALMRKLGLAGSVSAGTILINGATALHSFGMPDAAAEAFDEAYRCYRAGLPENDRKFAGLFNNMAAVYAEKNDFDRAENLYLQALEILSAPADLMDYAVTCVNLAQLYCRRDPADPAVDTMLDAAMLAFDHPDAARDGYYAHSCSKCAGAFSDAGRGNDAAELIKRSEAIYAGN